MLFDFVLDTVSQSTLIALEFNDEVASSAPDGVDYPLLHRHGVSCHHFANKVKAFYQPWDFLNLVALLVTGLCGQRYSSPWGIRRHYVRIAAVALERASHNFPVDTDDVGSIALFLWQFPD